MLISAEDISYAVADDDAPLSSNRQYLSCDACLEVKREESELLRAVLCTIVVHNDKLT